TGSALTGGLSIVMITTCSRVSVRIMRGSILPGVIAAPSLWNATLPAGARTERPPLDGDVVADVAIAGAGFTGLWTAYALLQAEPTLRVVICECESVGFGASGRNGGWCSALFAGSRATTARRHGAEAVVAMQRAMFATLDEIERVLAGEGIACD